MAPAVAVACMVILTALFVAEASRRGTGRMLAAMGVSVAWLAVTAVALRSANQVEVGSAARDYAIVMGVSLLVYFLMKGRRSDGPRDPVP